jgi:2-hydroxychromene-2-carboxylate isomerase
MSNLHPSVGASGYDSVMKTIEFFFDLSSPYSYLAATQLAPLAVRHNATLLWKPLVLAAVFKATGNVMPAVCEPKARNMLIDLDRWARKYAVSFTMNSRFPMNTIKPERMIIAAEAHNKSQELAQGFFHAMWVEDRDIAAEHEMRAIAAGVGLDASVMMSAIETSAVKDKLRVYTDEAIARGVFGAPAIFVGSEMFWGNDRIDFVADALGA